MKYFIVDDYGDVALTLELDDGWTIWQHVKCAIHDCNDCRKQLYIKDCIKEQQS